MASPASSWAAGSGAIRGLYGTAAASLLEAEIVTAEPRVFMPYIGGFPAYVEKCDAVADNAYEGFALA